MRILPVFLLLCLAWMAAGCNLPQPAAPVAGLPQAWLDAPLDGSLLSWAPYEVVFSWQRSRRGTERRVQRQRSGAGRSRQPAIGPIPGHFSGGVDAACAGGIYLTSAHVKQKRNLE